MVQANGNALRRIPSLDSWLRNQQLSDLPRNLVARTSRAFLEQVRRRVAVGELNEAGVQALFDSGEAESIVRAQCLASERSWHRRVINATGVVLHTGIGRAPLPSAARAAVQQALGYAIVEVDPTSGERNEREVLVAELLAELTGAEAGLVVNNNAAMVVLVLAALARGKEVVISRGQLVEIGGGFRMPDVMAQAGCTMVEVGTTNRTHLRDFEQAVGPATSALLLVHPSNFRVVGFTAMPSRQELVTMARERGVLVIDDVGSGYLLRHDLPGLEGEPRLPDVVSSGVDVACFSGDKLLGGPQCGILVGRRELVQRVRRHPLYRALRCDKLTLAALEATLRVYRDGEPCQEIPVLQTLTVPASELRERAGRLAAALASLDAVVVPSESFVGSGANPARPLPSFAVALAGGEALAARLRAPGDVPAVFTRIADGRVLLDLRTLALEDLDEVAALVRVRLTPSLT